MCCLCTVIATIAEESSGGDEKENPLIGANVCVRVGVCMCVCVHASV